MLQTLLYYLSGLYINLHQLSVIGIIGDVLLFQIDAKRLTEVQCT